MKEVIALIDCNNFFVSCERLFRPELAGRPVLVLSSNDGCVIARSEEVKALGIKMGDPYFKVRELCRQRGVVVFSSNFALYRDLSRRVMDVLRRFSDSVEVYSVDEAFLELGYFPADLRSQQERERVPSRIYGFTKSLYSVGEEIRDTVVREVGIPVSVGIAPTKTLAKVASHYAKPKHGGEGVRVLMEEQERVEALAKFPVADVWGVGWRLAPVLKGLGIRTAGELMVMPNDWIRKRMSIRGVRTVEELRGLRCFTFVDEGDPRKSLLHSRSFGSPVRTYPELAAAVAYHARKVAETLRAEKVCAREVGVLIRTSRHRTHDRYQAYCAEVLPLHTHSTLDLTRETLSILERIYKPGYPYAKAGVVVHDIVPEGMVPGTTLFGEGTEEHKPLMQAIDSLRAKFGEVVRVGAEAYGACSESAWYAEHRYLSPRYTTSWTEVPTVSKLS